MSPCLRLPFLTYSTQEETIHVRCILTKVNEQFALGKSVICIIMQEARHMTLTCSLELSRLLLCRLIIGHYTDFRQVKDFLMFDICVTSHMYKNIFGVCSC